MVLTDVERWGYRVNYLYIPLDEKDRDAHEAELKRNGIGNETALIQTGKGNFYPLLKRKKRKMKMRKSGKPGTAWSKREPSPS